ncbi:hypothetical protein AMTR_s00112p00030960 [Amborella trichopoda]|uniref:Transposase MuDR plant domain-containing protein n=1 Tax=Amborella trichopoda TaxID=13333 RepID=W1NZG5_AMBTC|nr:hypothetical protein AMTR_s00112p00030960 [Amborella trichopoda]
MRNHLIDYAISQNFNMKLIKREVKCVWKRCATDGCSWQVHCWRINTTNSFRVKKFVNVHSCAGLIGHQPLARSQWVASKIKDRLNDTSDLTAGDVVNDIQHDHDVMLSYQQA